jgi:hypothetical protein
MVADTDPISIQLLSIHRTIRYLHSDAGRITFAIPCDAISPAE